jgi:hypothetical protein
MSTQALLDKIDLEWTKIHVEESPNAHPILKLALLRRLFRDLHAHQSQVLAQNPDEAHSLLSKKNLELLEKKIESLREMDLSDASLSKLLKRSPGERSRGKSSPGKRKRKPLPAIPENFELIKKLERPDRRWEQALAFEAKLLDWRFWNLEAQVLHSEVVLFHTQLEKTLWPKGVVLFVESIKSSQEDAWAGKWFTVCSPSFIPENTADLSHPRWRMI